MQTRVSGSQKQLQDEHIHAVIATEDSNPPAYEDLENVLSFTAAHTDDEQKTYDNHGYEFQLGKIQPYKASFEKKNNSIDNFDFFQIPLSQHFHGKFLILRHQVKKKTQIKAYDLIINRDMKANIFIFITFELK